MVALKHKARLLLHWHHICFGLAYMAGTSQHYNAGIMFWAWQSVLWMEKLFLVASYTVLDRKVVCSLQSCHLSLFKWTVFFLGFFIVRAGLLHTKWAARWGVMPDSWEAVSLSWFWPRNALILFIIIILFPPAYCICTLISAIFIYTARLLIKAKVMLVWKMEMVHERGIESLKKLQ